VASEAEWRTLCTTIGRPELCSDARFASEPDRQMHQVALRQELEAWTRQRTKREAMDLLQQAGLRAGAVLTGAEMLQDPHLRARGYYREVTHPRAGKHTLRLAPYHLSETPPTIRKAAPCLGEDTESVLRELLGVGDADLDELAQAHVTDNVPALSVPSDRVVLKRA
jgi:crotonobetainyl-CoA:carnitine CoA-transferase CaiB-like acyl-CoA transferase